MNLLHGDHINEMVSKGLGTEKPSCYLELNSRHPEELEHKDT